MVRQGSEGDAAGMMLALIGLAHALGCEVTAENVETAEQFATLRDLLRYSPKVLSLGTFERCGGDQNPVGCRRRTAE